MCRPTQLKSAIIIACTCRLHVHSLGFLVVFHLFNCFMFTTVFSVILVNNRLSLYFIIMYTVSCFVLN